MRGQYECTACGFSVPADEIGVAIMKQHLKESHQEQEREDPHDDERP